MSAMNPSSFVKIMHLLNLTSADLSQALYVSPSHVSRWRNGSRELKDTNTYFAQLIDFFLSVNESRGEHQLEKLLLPDYDSIQNKKSHEALRAMLEQKLRQFLVVYSQETRAPHDVEASAIQVTVGLENRIEALKQFFEHALTLNPKPDIYIKEVLYASWCPTYLDWFSLCHEYALRYMDAGGVIYYFSNLNNIDRATFYSIWQFTSHKNLYPGYSVNMVEESPGCAYYLAEGVRSVTFYVPEDHFKSYITTVSSDPLMLSAQGNYLKKKYDQLQHQIFINTSETRNFVFNMVQLHQKKLNPLLFGGKQPNFLFLSTESLKKLLRENHISDKAIKFCLEFQQMFQAQLADPALQKTFFYYEEDILEFAVSPEVVDLELSSIVGEPIHVSWDARKELLMNLRAACANSSHAIRIVSKKNAAVYDALGEAITLWVKRNNWYLIYYPDNTKESDLRLITDALACTLRYDLYYQTLLNVPNNCLETAAFLSEMIYILERSSPPPADP